MSMFETTFIPFNIDYSAGSRNGSHWKLINKIIITSHQRNLLNLITIN
jgi:hypothetical protein